MSDQLAAAAQAMGVPESIIERSARARATATGQSYEDVIAAWAGGETIAAAPPPSEPATTDSGPEPDAAPTEPTTPAAPAEPTAAPASPEYAAAAASGSAAGAVDSQPPVLDAPPDRPLATVAGGLAVLVLTVLLGVVFPSLPPASTEVRSSAIVFSESAIQGQAAYLHAGCASCHTQAIRSVVADVGLGPVTLSDTNQIIGFRRIGPDLADVGSRLSADQIAVVLEGGSHPPMALSGDALVSLVSYLSESKGPKAVGAATEGGQS